MTFMKPQRHTKATLVDLLDRVLDKGLVIHADLVISVAGIPLIGVSLKAALAGMETMVKYGMMKQWDQRIRAQEHDRQRSTAQFLANGEEVLLKALGSWYCEEGLHPAWRYGHIYLTPKRMFIYQHPFDRMLFEVPLRDITQLFTPDVEGEEEGMNHELNLVMDDGRVERLRSTEVKCIQGLLEQYHVGASVVIEKDVWRALLKETEANGSVDAGEVVCIETM